MSQEIERRFVLEGEPAGQLPASGTRLAQGYLCSGEGLSVRIRIVDTDATLTVKGGGGLARTEVDLPLGTDDAQALWPFTAGQRIDKVRYRVPLGPDGPVAEVDRYAGQLEGLLTAEVEFDDEQQAEGFRAPAWFGREVTGDPAWSNAALARHGRPDRPGGTTPGE